MIMHPVHLLNDGSSLPQVGFGTYPLRGDDAVRAIHSAIEIGYRLIDTAVNYRNEDAVGRALAESPVHRDELIVATKLPGRHHGYDETMASYEESRRALGVDQVDLYLIHWPNPSVGRFAESWRAMVDLQKQERVRSIGVSNFTQEHLERIGAETGVLPAVNQIEVHPYFPQEALIEFHREHGIITEAWSPLGRGARPYNEAIVVRMAEAYGRTPAQIVLRWHLQRGVIPIPKSADPGRQRENAEITDFELTQAEVDEITALGRPDGRLFGGDPNTHEEM